MKELLQSNMQKRRQMKVNIYPSYVGMTSWRIKH